MDSFELSLIFVLAERRQDDYNATPTSDKRSSSSDQDNITVEVAPCQASTFPPSP
ncbi:hypothetical protein E2320_022426 [Naja naja]|nr:hypothetical protein E2320_022426 [Naja naja]